MNPLSTWLLRLSLALLAAAVVVPVLFLAGSPAAAQQAVPDQPEGLTGELLHYLVVGLDWDDAEGATSYRAQYWDTTGDSPAWAEAPEAEYDGSSAVVSGLPDQRFYYFQVRAVNDAGASEWSDFFLTDNAWPDTPTPEPTPTTTPEPTPTTTPEPAPAGVEPTPTTTPEPTPTTTPEPTPTTTPEPAPAGVEPTPTTTPEPTPTTTPEPTPTTTPEPTPTTTPEPAPAGVEEPERVAFPIQWIWLSGVGMSYVGPGGDGEASGHVQFDDDRVANIRIDADRDTMAVCIWADRSDVSVTVDHEDVDTSYSMASCPEPVDFRLERGKNELRATVTSADGLVEITYTIVIKPRRPPPLPGNAVAPVESYELPEFNGRHASGVTPANADASQLWLATDGMNGCYGRNTRARFFIRLFDVETQQFVSGEGFSFGRGFRCNDGIRPTITTGKRLSSLWQPPIYYDQSSKILWAAFREIRSEPVKVVTNELIPFQRTDSGWRMLANQTINLTHYDGIPSGWSRPPTGVYSDGTTIWVSGPLYTAYAYDIATRARDSSKDLTIPGEAMTPYTPLTNYGRPGGLWSDGETVYVSGRFLEYVFAYDKATLSRAPERDFRMRRFTSRPRHWRDRWAVSPLWSDGEHLWVREYGQGRFAAYPLPTAGIPEPIDPLAPIEGPYVNRPPQFDRERYAVEVPRSSGDVAELVVVSASDPDGGPLTYRVSGSWPAAFSLGPRSGAIAYSRGEGPAPAPGRYELVVSADDHAGGEDQATVVVTVTNGAPSFGQAQYAADLPGDSGDVAGLVAVSATDPEHDPLRYAAGGSWDARFAIDPQSGVISYTRGDGPPIAAGEYRLSVTAADGYGGTAETAVVVTVAPPLGICGRTPQVRDAILARLSGISDCAAVTDADLGAIGGDLGLSGIAGTQDLDREKIRALKSGDFGGLSSLRRLWLPDNSLEALPEDVFEGLSALTSLHLQNNGLQELPEDVFEPLGSLTTLRLENNELSELPEGVFDGLSGLDGLFLTLNGLSALPEDVFEGLTAMEVLYLDGNELSALPAEVFDGLSGLRELRLNGNSLSGLPAGVFEGLSGLRGLELESNDLETLPAGVFEGLSGLERLFLDGNEGAPFTLTAELERRGDGAVAVKVVEGAPFAIEVKLSADGGTLSPDTVTIEAGSTASEAVSVAPAGEGRREVTVSVASAEFVGVVVAVGKIGNYGGIQTGLGEELVLDFEGNPQGPDGDGAESAPEPEASPAVGISLSSGSVGPGAEIGVTMSFSGLEPDSDTATTDYVFRADVKNSENGNADACEDRANGYGLGVDRYMHKVDQDPETRTGTISAGCPAGDYTLRASVSSPDGVELAAAGAVFSIAEPAEPPQSEPASNDATLSGLVLSGMDIGAFDPATTDYAADVDHHVDQTTATPTANDDGATYLVKLDGLTDEDGVIPLAVGSNAITVEVTAEDGNTAKTYKVTVARAAPPLSADAALSGLVLSGMNIGAFDPATTEYAADVDHDVTETTVTPTLNDDGASYLVKLNGVADADGTVSLSEGSNTITVEVTAADGETAKTYTVTVARAAPPAPQPTAPPAAPDAPTGRLDGAGNASLDWNDVATATSYQVNLWWNNEWTALPNAEAAGVGVAFDGSRATVSGLPTQWTLYWFQVRAVNSAGHSHWSHHSKVVIP